MSNKVNMRDSHNSYCQECGSVLIKGSKFCSNCGSKLKNQNNMNQSTDNNLQKQCFDKINSEYDENKLE